MINKRRSAVDSIRSSRCYLDYDYEAYNSKEHLTWYQRHRCCLIAVTSILSILTLIFIVIFVALPVIFMISTDFRQTLIFFKSRGRERDDFANFKVYGIEGVKNIYASLNSNVTLGIWHILPLQYTYWAVQDDNYDYEKILRESEYPVLMYFHDSGVNRAISINKYLILRRFYHIVAFDYRCFGDSDCDLMSEREIVNDAVDLYKWLRSRTSKKVYFWGHTLGAAVATKAIRELRKEFIVPTGLILESPFTNLEDEILNYPLVWVISWTPWFKETVLDPLNATGLHFKTDEYILSVDCPIMILHSKDDKYVPFVFSKKLLDISNQMRAHPEQGNTTLHLLPTYLHYGHNDLYRALELPDNIREHLNICNFYNMGRD